MISEYLNTYIQFYLNKNIFVHFIETTGKSTIFLIPRFLQTFIAPFLILRLYLSPIARILSYLLQKHVSHTNKLTINRTQSLRYKEMSQNRAAAALSIIQRHLTLYPFVHRIHRWG